MSTTYISLLNLLIKDVQIKILKHKLQITTFKM